MVKRSGQLVWTSMGLTEGLSMKTEKIIKLDRFLPRHYQLPIFDAIENKGFKKVICILPRRARQGYCSV
jgi:hypothetical protein